MAMGSSARRDGQGARQISASGSSSAATMRKRYRRKVNGAADCRPSLPVTKPVDQKNTKIAGMAA